MDSCPRSTKGISEIPNDNGVQVESYGCRKKLANNLAQGKGG